MFGGWSWPRLADVLNRSLSIIGGMRLLSDDADRLTVREDGDGIEAREYPKQFRENPHRPPPAFGSRR
jgi:hypothetical protein